MVIINYLPKIQAIDKSIAMIAQLKLENNNIKAITILNIEEKNQIGSAKGLFEILGTVSELVIICGETSIHDEASISITCNSIYVKDYKANNNYVILFELQKYIETNQLAAIRDKYLLIPFTGESSNLGLYLAEQLKRNSYSVIAYFKSLHDQGLGLTTVMDTKTNLFSNIFKYLPNIRVGKAVEKDKTNRFAKVNPDQVDVLLAFNKNHEKILKKSISSNNIKVAGYPLLYPAWSNIVNGSTYVQEYNKNGFYDLVIFTRGETPGRSPINNVLPHDTLKKILLDIYAVILCYDKKFRIRIKPHPIQDVSFIETIILDWRVPVEIVYEPPSILAATADTTISTYTSTVVDALILGIPSIEYYIENDFFKKKHPSGSPFGALGAMVARNKSEFEEHFRSILKGEIKIIDIENKLEHRSEIQNMFIGQEV